jgi:bifunctional non-homologous end joining protein LigD
LTSLLTKTPAGIRISEHIEADGETVFRHACKLGCEGIVSKQRASTYRSGRVRTWIKVKNPASPAMTRVRER